MGSIIMGQNNKGHNDRSGVADCRGAELQRHTNNVHNNMHNMCIIIIMGMKTMCIIYAK